MKYVIIGAGAAGISAASAIRKYDNRGSITVLSKEPHEPYSLCSLPSYLCGEITKDKMTRFTDNFWRTNKITLRKDTEVTKVLPRKNRVELATGKTLSYDRLLVATGSGPLIPDVKGNRLDGIFSLNSLDDCNKINNWLKNKKEPLNAVIIGGGFIGLEAASALHAIGLKVTVIEMVDCLLPRMVDADISKVVEKLLLNNGIKVKLKCEVKEIEGDSRVKAIKTTRGRVAADIVLWCVGVRPNLAFLKKSGIRIKQGVSVNSKLQTNSDNIYAAGDIIESPDRFTKRSRFHANWPNALEQGHIAGANMAGHSMDHTATFNINTIDIFDTPVISIGLTSKEHNEQFGKNWELHSRKYGRGKTPLVNIMMTTGGKLSGFQSVGISINTGWLIAKLRSGNELEYTESLKRSMLFDNMEMRAAAFNK